jgi:hypothetical protein
MFYYLKIYELVEKWSGALGVQYNNLNMVTDYGMNKVTPWPGLLGLLVARYGLVPDTASNVALYGSNENAMSTNRQGANLYNSLFSSIADVYEQVRESTTGKLPEPASSVVPLFGDAPPPTPNQLDSAILFGDNGYPVDTDTTYAGTSIPESGLLTAAQSARQPINRVCTALGVNMIQVQDYSIDGVVEYLNQFGSFVAINPGYVIVTVVGYTSDKQLIVYGPEYPNTKRTLSYSSRDIIGVWLPRIHTPTGYPLVPQYSKPQQTQSGYGFESPTFLTYTWNE